MHERTAALILIAAGSIGSAAAQSSWAQTAIATARHHLESDSGAWSQYRGNARRTAFAPWESGWTPEILWRLDLGPLIDPSPVVGPDGTIYIVGVKAPVWALEQLVAVNPDGTIKWKTIMGGYRLRATPSIRNDGSIVAVGYNIYVDRIELDSEGNVTKVAWKREAKVFLVGADGRIVARSGQNRFFVGPGLSSPAYASTSDDTGRYIRWRAPISDASMRVLPCMASGASPWRSRGIRPSRFGRQQPAP